MPAPANEKDPREGGLPYEVRGTGPETIVFAHGLLFSSEMFEQVVEQLAPDYRCVAFDFPGHGKTPLTAGVFDIEAVTDQVEPLLHALGPGPFHFLGFSLGGFVGLRLAIRRGVPLQSLILVGTSAEAEPEENRRKYRRLARMVRWWGRLFVMRKVLGIMFGKEYLKSWGNWRKAWGWIWRIPRRSAYLAALGVIDRKPVADRLGEITVPTLVLRGAEDQARTPEETQRLADQIPGAGGYVVEVERAGHMVPEEKPRELAGHIRSFLQNQT